VQKRAIGRPCVNPKFVFALTKPAEGDAPRRRKMREIKPTPTSAPRNADCPTRIMAFHTSALPFMSVEKERIAMNLLLAGKARGFALVTCAMLTCGCQSGVNSSVAPSAISSVSASTGSNGAVVMPGDLITMQGAPVSYPMNERVVNGLSSGFWGTCTVSTTHTGGIRVKADGQGAANSLIQLNVVDISSPLLLRTTDYVDVNQQGAFRTNWRAIEPGDFTAGDSLQCWLTSDSDTVLANSTNFSAP
jgi:hypothetical protein